MLQIAILTGGISTEREVALRSGKNMKDWCEIAGYHAEIFDIPKEIDAYLKKYQSFDMTIPVLHGRYGEDGVITGLCESLGISVAGSSSGVHALCIDKFHTNCVVEKLGIKVPKTWIPGLPSPPKLLPSEDTENLETIVIIKPNQGGSSLATTKAYTLQEFRNGIKDVNTVIESLTAERILFLESKNMNTFQRKFSSLKDMPMVQECIEGLEFTVGVYKDNSGTHVLPIIEIVTEEGEFFDYREKYETDGSNEVFSEIETSLKKALEDQSILIYDFLGCRGITRLDWRYDGRDIYFLEVNTIPGFTSGSLVPKMWKKAGKTEKEFVKMLFGG